jgi:hypothetical protein
VAERMEDAWCHASSTIRDRIAYSCVASMPEWVEAVYKATKQSFASGQRKHFVAHSNRPRGQQQVCFDDCIATLLGLRFHHVKSVWLPTA